jgi:hypothetical protein
MWTFLDFILAWSNDGHELIENRAKLSFWMRGLERHHVRFQRLVTTLWSILKSVSIGEDREHNRCDKSGTFREGRDGIEWDWGRFERTSNCPRKSTATFLISRRLMRISCQTRRNKPCFEVERY